MSKNTGLGRGLGSLISRDMDRENIREIDMEKIMAREDQPRKFFDEDALEELQKSIEKYGVIQPILCREKQNKYEIIAGERRYRAAKMAGLKNIPVIVKNIDEKSLMEISLIENIQRQDLNPIEEALAYEDLREEFQYTQEELSEKLGKSRSYIANTIRLLRLDDETKSYLRDGQITSSQARTLLSIDDLKERNKYLHQLLKKETNIRRIEGRNRKKRIKNSYVKDLENRLIEHFSTKVGIRQKKKGGQIVIDYLSHDDLERILNLLEVE
ncbi:MAG: ParB/RepB/Spo0J family partition protein [Tissierellia bacterium]|nr:ParB/RepB/Spo0J family partition protein [Tissierellia bacterium]